MGRSQEFEAYFDGTFEKTLPHELVEQYDVIECLSCVEGCDTLLVKQKTTGNKIVAKCYTQKSVLFNQSFQNMKSKAVPEFVGEYRNEKYRCILREYIEGISLDKFVTFHHMTEEIIVDTAIKLARIMKALHHSEQVIIHRDIKPQNIIVREDGSLALIDFGISRIYKKNGISDTVICGTEAFAPPEQYGFLQTDIRSDIYSFGVVLSWMITGRARPIRNPITKLERIAVKCCQFSPSRRYKNDEALLRDLHRATREHVVYTRKVEKATAFAIAGIMCAGCIPFWTRKMIE